MGTGSFFRWLRFNAVGGIGFGVQMLCLVALTRVAHLHYLIATALSVEAAILHNFCWHQRFTWADRTRAGVPSARRLWKFNLTTGLFSIGGNLLLMRLLVGLAHLPCPLANLLTIVICSLVNFLLSDRFVFSVRQGLLPPQRGAAGADAS